jgi:hypothetical protein
MNHKKSARLIKIFVLIVGTVVLVGGIITYHYLDINNAQLKQTGALGTKNKSEGDIESHGVETNKNTPQVSLQSTTQGGKETYINIDGIEVDSPNSDPLGATAQCVDGLYSHSQNPSGTCSSHGGIRPFCSIVKSQYDSKISTENTRYVNELGTFKEQMNSAGLYDSGQYWAGIESIENKHTINLSEINNWYSVQICWNI